MPSICNYGNNVSGALYLDGGIDLADRVFAETLFKDEEKYLNIWRDLPLHVLQEDEPGSDRHWVESSPTLQVIKVICPWMKLDFNFNTCTLYIIFDSLMILAQKMILFVCFNRN